MARFSPEQAGEHESQRKNPDAAILCRWFLRSDSHLCLDLLGGVCGIGGCES